MNFVAPEDFSSIVVSDHFKLEIDASEMVWSAINKLERTEDCRFSPNGKKLAVAGFAKHSIIVFNVAPVTADMPQKIRLSDYVEIVSDVFSYPHGLDFVDDTTLVIGNRRGAVTVINIPEPVSDAESKQAEIQPLVTISKANIFSKINSPGSVSVTRVTDDEYDLLVCNNYNNRVTEHSVSRKNGHKVISNKILLENRLKIPDGVTQSARQHVFAVSNHLTHEVYIYRSAEKNTRRSLPQGVLKGSDFPHGLRFFGNDRYLLVADAGLPFSRLYHCADGEWNGEFDPVKTIRFMNDEIFLKGRTNHQEGGLKGLDFSPDEKILATTCEMQPLVFYDAAGLMSAALAPHK